MWFSSVRHSLSTDYDCFGILCVLTDQLVAAFWRCWSLCDYINEIKLIIFDYICYIELSTSLSTLWFRVSTLRAWLKAKGLPLLGELLADSVSVLEDWTDWTNRVAFVKSFHLAILLNDKRSSNLFLKEIIRHVFPKRSRSLCRKGQTAKDMRLQWEAWPAEISESSLRARIKLCDMSQHFKSRSRPGLLTSSFCRQSDYVESSVLQETRFKRSNCRLFCLQKLHCYALFGCLFQRWEHRQTLGKAFDRLHRWVLSMNSISSVCKHEMSCSLTCERFFWRFLPSGFFLSFCSLFLQVGVVAKRQQERLNSGRLAWLWAGDVTFWRTSRHFGENHRPSCGQYVQCEYSVSTVNIFGHFDSLALTLAVWVSEIRSRQEMATAAEACKYRHASKQSSQGPAAQIISLHFCISPFLHFPSKSQPSNRHTGIPAQLQRAWRRWSEVKVLEMIKQGLEGRELGKFEPNIHKSQDFEMFLCL